MNLLYASGCFSMDRYEGISQHAKSAQGRHGYSRRRYNAPDDLLYVRLPMRHQRSPEGRQGQIHRRQPQPSGEQGRAVRQGQRRDHAALLTCPPARPDETGRAARIRPVRRNQLGRGAGAGDRLARLGAQEGSPQAGVLHGPRSKPKPDGVLGDAIWHAEFCRPRRVLFGQYGRRGALYLWRGLLGVWRPGLGFDQVFHALRRGRGSCQQPDQNRHRQAEGARRQDRVGQSGAHRL